MNFIYTWEQFHGIFKVYVVFVLFCFVSGKKNNLFLPGSLFLSDPLILLH